MAALIQNVLVLGLGKVGQLVATLVNNAGFTALGLDVAKRTSRDFKSEVFDIANAKKLEVKMKSFDAVISCLPFHLNKAVALAAFNAGIHYFDLTEDVGTTQYIMGLGKKSKKAMVPQCGLAPGFIGIIASSLAREFDGPLRVIEMRVGALPQHPIGDLGYSVNWSVEGVINEYIKDCEIVRNGEKRIAPPLEFLETLVIDGVQLEAFTTSGGLGTMCDTYAGKVKHLDYKSIRYPGHCNLMRFFLRELHMDERFEEACRIIEGAKPPTSDDVVYVSASVEGKYKGGMKRREFVRSYRPVEINGREWTAIAWTTAASAVAVIEMVRDGKLPTKGFVRQEDIPLDAFLKTHCGAYYAG